MGDLLIRGGSVIDGTGTPAFQADVRVTGGRIAEIGPGLRPDGEPQLDASGAVVTPGFIDTHTHFDPSAFWDPAIDPMPQHGVTSVLMGNCSLSLAPLRSEHRSDLSAVFSYIEDLPRRAFETSIPWSWETYGEYRAAMSGSLRRSASRRRRELMSLCASVASSQARCRPSGCPRSVSQARAAASNVSCTRSAASSVLPLVRAHACPNSHRSCAAKNPDSSAMCHGGILTELSSMPL